MKLMRYHYDHIRIEENGTVYAYVNCDLNKMTQPVTVSPTYVGITRPETLSNLSYVLLQLSLLQRQMLQAKATLDADELETWWDNCCEALMKEVNTKLSTS